MFCRGPETGRSRRDPSTRSTAAVLELCYRVALLRVALQKALPPEIFLILYSEPAEENFVQMGEIVIKTPTVVC